MKKNMPRTTSQKTHKTSVTSSYQNNPFFVAAEGVSLVARLAGGVALVLLVLSLLAVFSDVANRGSSFTSPDDLESAAMQWSTTDWLLAISSITIIGLAVIMILALFSGVSAYTSYRISQNKETSIKESFGAAFDHLWAFLWLQIIINVKIFLWTLLLIVPGVIWLTDTHSQVLLSSMREKNSEEIKQ